MARKKTANGSAIRSEGKLSGDASGSTPVTDPVTESPGPATSRIDILAANANIERDEIKVNNASLVDLKNACDDAVKKVRALSSIDPLEAHSCDACSYFQDQTYFNKITHIRTLSLASVGRAYSLLWEQLYTAGKSILRNQNHSYGLV